MSELKKKIVYSCLGLGLFVQALIVFVFRLDSNIIIESPYDKSIQDILLFNTNKFYVNYFDQALFFDFGIAIPLIVVVFSIMYIQIGDHINKPFWNLLIIFLSLNLFFRIDTNSKLIYVAILILFFINLKFEVMNIKLNYFEITFLWIITLLIQNRIGFEFNNSCFPDCRFNGELILTLFVSIISFLVFKEKFNFKYIFVFVFMSGLVLNPLNYEGGILCCGNSGFEKNDNTITVSKNQWENFGKQDNSYRTEDYKTIESLSSNINPYDNNSQYPPMSLLVTNVIEEISSTLYNYPSIFKNVYNLSYLIFLSLTVNLFLLFYHLKYKTELFKNIFLFTALIFLNSIYPSTLIIFLLKGLIYLALINLNKDTLKNLNNNFYVLVPISFAFIYAVDRGNIDMVIFPIILIFLHYFFNQRFLISSIFLSLAISLKIFPALLLFLFFQKKLFKYALVTISWCTGIFFLSIFLLNIKLQSVFQIFSSVINFSSGSLFTNPVAYSGLNTSFIGFTKQYLSFLNLGFIYGNVSETGQYDIYSSFGLWSGFYILPFLNFFLLLYLLMKLVLYVVRTKKITLEVVILVNLIFLIYFPLNFIYRISVFLALLLFCQSKFNYKNLSIPILILLIPTDLFYFPTHLEIVHLGGLVYFPICIHLFKELLNNNTEINIDI